MSANLFDRAAHLSELLLIMHLLQMIFQPRNFLMQRPDLLAGGLLLVALLQLLELLRGLAQDVVGDVAQPEPLAIGGRAGSDY